MRPRWLVSSVDGTSTLVLVLEQLLLLEVLAKSTAVGANLVSVRLIGSSKSIQIGKSSSIDRMLRTCSLQLQPNSLSIELLSHWIQVPCYRPGYHDSCCQVELLLQRPVQQHVPIEPSTHRSELDNPRCTVLERHVLNAAPWPVSVASQPEQLKAAKLLTCLISRGKSHTGTLKPSLVCQCMQRHRPQYANQSSVQT